MKNIILIMSDQHAGRASCFANHPIVKTPNLDKLAADSTVFQNAYCPAPICGPSRFAFLTGQHVHRCGSYDNGSSLHYDEPTLGTLMTNAGYRSVLCGRMHLHGPEQYAGFEERPVAGWINPVHAPPSSMLPNDYKFPDYSGMNNGNEYNHYQTSRLHLKSIDDHTIATACDLIKNHNKIDSRPLFILIGLYGPHPATSEREEYREFIEMYDKMDIDVPEFSAEQLHKTDNYLKNKILRLGNGKLPDKEYNRKKLCEYYARITYMDKLTGQVLDCLKKTGYYNDSYVIYTSDHGESMGHKGIWGKVTFLEDSVKVPLILKTPSNDATGIENANVSLVDIFPTLAEITHTDVPYEIAGNSLLSVNKPHDNSILSQYHGIYTNTSGFMLKSGKYKYNFYNNDKPELFDIDADPDDNENLAKNPDYDSLRHELHQKLLDKLGMSPEAVEKIIRTNQEKRQFIADSVKKSKTQKDRLKSQISEWRKMRNEPWWDDEAEDYMRNYETHLQD